MEGRLLLVLKHEVSFVCNDKNNDKNIKKKNNESIEEAINEAIKEEKEIVHVD